MNGQTHPKKQERVKLKCPLEREVYYDGGGTRMFSSANVLFCSNSKWRMPKRRETSMMSSSPRLKSRATSTRSTVSPGNTDSPSPAGFSHFRRFCNNLSLCPTVSNYLSAAEQALLSGNEDKLYEALKAMGVKNLQPQNKGWYLKQLLADREGKEEVQ